MKAMPFEGIYGPNTEMHMSHEENEKERKKKSNAHLSKKNILWLKNTRLAVDI